VIWVFYIFLFVIAFFYASVGHGGASGYLALMAIAGYEPGLMRPTALVLNLFVSGMAFIQFYRGGFFRCKVFLPFAIASIPLALLGGMIPVDAGLYKKILGVLLLFTAVRMLWYKTTDPNELKEPQFLPAILAGGVIGFISGLIGIGGGILLSPLLLFLKWSDQKQAAAISALFIFVNSLAGLTGQWIQGLQAEAISYSFILPAIGGGMLGSWLGAHRFDSKILKYILSAVLLFAVYKLLFV
jgi:uncharacterized membrane protein YfcA